MEKTVNASRKEWSIKLDDALWAYSIKNGTNIKAVIIVTYLSVYREKNSRDNIFLSRRDCNL